MIPPQKKHSSLFLSQSSLQARLQGYLALLGLSAYFCYFGHEDKDPIICPPDPGSYPAAFEIVGWGNVTMIKLCISSEANDK